MTIDHLGELLVRLEPLPLEAGAPVLKEAPRPALALVAPQLAEAFLRTWALLSRLLADNSAFNAFLPSSVRFSLRDSSVYLRRPAATADIIGKALGVERIVRQKVEPLPLHLATAATVEASHLRFKKIRVSPHDRSRTRRTLRSYQPICTRPQQPQAVFLNAA